jgi:hypothetical protein
VAVIALLRAPFFTRSQSIDSHIKTSLLKSVDQSLF